MAKTRAEGKRVPKAQPAQQPPPTQVTKTRKTTAPKNTPGTSTKAIQKTKPAKKAPATNSKTAPKSTAAKKAPATKSKTAPKSTAAKKAPATTSKTAQKAQAPSASTSKKRKAADDAPAPTQPKKARATKAPKPKVVINHAPTQKLNVYVFGEGSAGELGLGTAKNVIDVKRPRLNPLLSATDVGIVQIACGGMHVVGLTHDNKILTWGVNDQGALGRDTEWSGGYKDADKEDSDSEEDDSGLNPKEATPTPVTDFPAGTIFTHVAAADSATFAVTDEGKVWGWGTFRVSDRHIHTSTTRLLTTKPER